MKIQKLQCVPKNLIISGKKPLQKDLHSLFFVIYLRQGKIGMNLLAYMMS